MEQKINQKNAVPSDHWHRGVRGGAAPSLVGVQKPPMQPHAAGSQH